MESLVRLPPELLSGSPEELAGSLVVGVDGGATKTLAAAWAPGDGTVTLGLGGPSNPDAVGPERAADALEEAVGEAVGADRDASDIAAAVFALAGTDTDAVAQIVDSRFHYARTYTVNDVVAAWAAATECRPGVAVIAGTGSNVLGVGTGGEVWRAGGWGHVLGDEGSAYAIGLGGIRAACEARDCSGPQTPLYDDAPRHFEVGTVEEVAALVYQKPLTKGEIATFARQVSTRAEEGDEVAAALLDRAGNDLALLARTVVERTGLAAADADFVVGEVGSTWRAGPLLVDPFESAVSAAAPRASFRLVSEPPVYGALLLAGRATGAWTDDPPRDLVDLLARAESSLPG